jgi:lipopolysaccharide transport system ATP-binding protein
MSIPVISVRGLGKKYRLGATIRHDTLRDQIAHPFKSIFRRNSKKYPSDEGQRVKEQGHDSSEFWALRDISFDVHQGEIIGIIGRNGAGKSTLLKILSEITEPTTGEVRIRGRVGSLLEVGTGFHPELSGRENIFLNGAILGMTRAEIKARFDDIVAFSEIEKFLDTPVKRYSSGMFVRLAFAVAAHLDPEILFIDEVLAVGDVRFQTKCLGKMDEISHSGRTVLFVSHNMDAILSLCSFVYVIEGGRISQRFSPEEGVRSYLTMNRDQPLSKRPRFQLVHRPPIIHNLKIFDNEGRKNSVCCGQGINFGIELRDFADINRIAISIVITNDRNQRVVLFDTRYHANRVLEASSYASVSCFVPSFPLIPGNYYVDVILSDRNRVIEKVEQAAQFEVIFADFLGTGQLPRSWQGHIVLPCNWSSKHRLQSIS